jgi:hypothetical protein
MENNLKFLLDACPHSTDYSSFEQEHFNSTSMSGYPRYIIGLINRYRKVVSDLEVEQRTFEKNCLLEEKEKIESILSSQDDDKLKNAVANWEKVEVDYWVDTLGKIAAIEILTYGKVSYDTMMKMVKLPEEMYIKATQVCVKLANKIKETTVSAEEAIGLVNNEEATVKVTATAPKKLFLKKTK